MLKTEITHEDIMNVLRCGEELTRTQKVILAIIMDYEILRAKGKCEGTILKAITEEVGLTAANASINTKVLADMGLITKIRNINNRRECFYTPNMDVIRSLYRK